MLASCVSGPIPKWEGKVWLGRQKYVGIIFTKPDGTNDVIRADDPQFNDYIAMTTGDFKQIIVTYVEGCKQWKPGSKMMSAQEANARFQVLMKDLENESEQGAKLQ